MIPALARGVEGDPGRYLADNEWALEQKMNGSRLVVDGTMGRLRFFNKEGSSTNGPRAALKELEILTSINAVLDGEVVGKEFWVFDMPACGTLVTPASPWDDRRAALEALFNPKIWKPRFTRLLPAATTTARKRALRKKVWAAGHEGVMLKRRDAPYRMGERTSDWLKDKNVRTVDCIVQSFGTEKHNMQLTVYRDGELVEIGECSRYEGQAPQAKIGDVIEVAFLDAGSPESPRLCQPHAKRLRADKSAASCLLDQLDGTYANKKVLV